MYSSLIAAQTNPNNIIRDTSYTIYSATQKVQKEYPHSQVVKANASQNILYFKDITYIERGERQLKLDLFLPENNSEIKPAVILIHGGGWVTGDKSLMIPLAEEICSKGFVTAVVEYRLAPEAKYPAAIYDIKAAIKWVRKNSYQYYIDTNKIALLGCSAGGHLAAFVGTTNNNAKFDDISNNNFSSNVSAVIDIDGILDFTDPAESGKDSDSNKPSVGKRWLGASYRDNPTIWIEASPLNQVTKYSAPICYINSSLDRFHAGRDEMITKLNALNIYSTIFNVENSPHSFWLFYPWFNETVDDIQTFLKYIFNN